MPWFNSFDRNESMLPVSSRANYSHRAQPPKNWNQGRKRKKKKAAVCVVLETYVPLYGGAEETNVLVFCKAIFAVAALFFWSDFASFQTSSSS
jgi:hypothetical protein